jgi:hypothetical protein
LQWLMQQVDGRMIVLSDTAFHATEGDPANLKLCPRGEWEDRMLVETRGSRSPWPCSMCWSSGMASSPPRRVSCPSR